MILSLLIFQVNVSFISPQLFYNKFEADKVILFGSVAKSGLFNKWSDIDLATVGIPDNRFYAAVAAATGYNPEFKVDLVDLNDCSPTLKEAILREGVELNNGK